MRLRWLVTLAICAGIAARAQENVVLPAEVYQTPGPHVVVNGTLLKAPVREIRGSLFLPMRAVFEALGAEVRWFPAASQIQATRGSTNVQLWIARKVAIVDDREVSLTAAPVLMEGTTFVPLRFPAEAFGGEVRWIGSLRTASITLAPLGGGGTPAPPDPAPSAGTLEGVVVTKVTAGVTALVVEHARGETTLVQLAPGARITRANANAAPARAAFADIEPGDHVRITRDAAGRAETVAARYAQLKGTAAAVANNRLLLQDGSLYQLQPDVRVVRADGQTVPLARIGNGTPVTLDVTPDSTNVWRITVPVDTAAPPGAPADGSRGILTVAAVGYTRPLKAGDVLTIRVTGEPGADRVTADVGGVVRAVRLNETQPGTYVGRVTIQPNTNVTDAPISASMRLGGRELPVVKGAAPVTIDTRPPSFDALIPGDAAEIADSSPTIEAVVADPGGSGVNAATVQVLVDGRDVTRQATVSEGRIRYRPRSLAPGPVRVRIVVADQAGNTNAAEWTMNVTDAPASGQQWVRHNATRPLVAGQRLNLSARVVGSPSRLEWYLGSKRIGASTAPDAASGEYRAVYTVTPEDAVGEQSVSARVFTGVGQSHVLFAPRAVTVEAARKPFRVTAPADRARATDPLVVTGNATPGSRVRVTVGYEGRLAILPVKGELYKGVVEANAAGVWRTDEIGIDVALVRPDAYPVTVELLDPDGGVAETVKLNLTRR